MSYHVQPIVSAVCLTAALFLGSSAAALGQMARQQQSAGAPRPGPICASEKAPYRDFDFLIGDWDFFSMTGEKLGEHLYSRREEGCLILEEWKSVAGGTGTGMNFVDPETGRWRQVWMSPIFHIDYSGGLDESGAMMLEGRLHSNADGKTAPVRGIWTKEDDGSVKQEFLQLDEASGAWKTFYVGVSRRKAE